MKGFDEIRDCCPDLISGSHRLFWNQIIFISRGSGNIQVDARQYPVKPHSLFALAKGQVETLEFSKDARGFVILFSEEYLYKYPEDMGWIAHLSLLEHSDKTCAVELSDLEYAELLMLIRKMQSELASGNEFAQRDILVNAFRMFLLMAERAKRKHLRKNQSDESIHRIAFPAHSSEERQPKVNLQEDKDWQYIVAFRQELDKDFHASRSVWHYATKLNITQKKLNQITSKFLGKPAKKIIEERVLLEIKRLLLYTDNTVKEIGFSLGFTDPTNFNKFFKKYTMRTPVQFRTGAENQNCTIKQHVLTI